MIQKESQKRGQEARKVERLKEIEDIIILEMFMLENNCQLESCFIRAEYEGNETFILCSTAFGFFYYDFIQITCESFEKNKEHYDILQTVSDNSCLRNV